MQRRDMRRLAAGDGGDAAALRAFRGEEADRHDSHRIHLLFNNAGVGNSGSMIAHSREEWKPTFTICCTRAFLAMLQKAS